MIWLGAAWLTVAGAMLAVVVAMDVWEGDEVEPLSWVARIVVSLAWPAFLLWFLFDLARGETDEERE